MLATLLKNWRTLAISCVALLIAGFLFYGWAYQRGAAACESAHAAASLKAAQDMASANSAALGRELAATRDRARAAAQIEANIEASHEQNDDDPAPAIIQRTFDELRRLEGQNR